MAIKDGCFIVNLASLKGVIVFPAFGTPALVKAGEDLTVILALDEDAFKIYSCDGGTPNAGVKVPKSFALRLYNQLFLVPWERTGKDIENYKEYVNELIGLRTQWNHLYKNTEEAAKKFDDGKMTGFYLGEMKDANNDFPVELPGPEHIKGPFGVLHKGAVANYLMTAEKKAEQERYAREWQGQGQNQKQKIIPTYCHLFQLTIGGSHRLAEAETGNGNGVIKELLFLHLDWDAYSREYTAGRAGLHDQDRFLNNPSDDLLNQAIQNKQDAEAEDRLPALPEVEVTRTQGMEPPKVIRFKAISLDVKSITTGAGRSVDLNYLDYKPQPMLSRHPVFISAEKNLNVGVAADLHINSRQAVFKLVAPQVIPGALESDSPRLGEIFNEALIASQKIITGLTNASDIIILAGDVFDFQSSLDPFSLMGAESDNKSDDNSSPLDKSKPCADTPKVKTTAQLWPYMDAQKKFSENYHRGLDFFMVMQLMEYCYKKNKAVFFVTGNHEGWDIPYGTSPRMFFPVSLIEERPNAGVPDDHSLTFYEAALLFGPTYKERGPRENFKSENMNWLHQVMTPWKDCLQTYDQHNFLFLGWGDDESLLQPISRVLAGNTLPQAPEAVSDQQFALLSTMTDRKKSGSNILCSHFTYASFAEFINLSPKDRLPKLEEYINSFGVTEADVIASNSLDCIGTFWKNIDKVFAKLAAVNFTIAGHSHRAGAYTGVTRGYFQAIQEPNRVTSENGLSLQEIDLKKALNIPIHLVCPSSGLPSKQNISHTDKTYDLDQSQAMILKYNEQGPDKVEFLTANHPKPRLAAHLDLLWYDGSMPAFDLIAVPSFYKTLNSSPRLTVNPVPSWSAKVIDPSEQYCVYFKDKWLNFFNSGGNFKDKDHPIDYMRLYAVYTKGEPRPRAMPKNITVPRPEGDLNKCTLNILRNDILDFFELIPGFKINPGDFIFFLSIHFNNSFRGMDAQYCMKSPWCFPVRVASDGSSIMRGGAKLGDNGELPDYDTLKDIPEYKQAIERE